MAFVWPGNACRGVVDADFPRIDGPGFAVKKEGGGAGTARDDAVQPWRRGGRRLRFWRQVETGAFGRCEEQSPEGFRVTGLPREEQDEKREERSRTARCEVFRKPGTEGWKRCSSGG